MKSQVKSGLFCLLLAFLLGITIGWSFGASGLSSWWIYSLDIVMGVLLLIIIIGIYRRNKRYQRAISKDRDN